MSLGMWFKNSLVFLPLGSVLRLQASFSVRKPSTVHPGKDSLRQEFRVTFDILRLGDAKVGPQFSTRLLYSAEATSYFVATSF